MIVAAGFGAGFALVLLMVFMGWRWYSLHPTPWKEKLITSEYKDLQLGGRIHDDAGFAVFDVGNRYIIHF